MTRPAALVILRWLPFPADLFTVHPPFMQSLRRSLSFLGIVYKYALCVVSHKCKLHILRSLF